MNNAVKLKSSLLAGLATLLLLFPSFGFFKRSDLKDIAKPYLGVYECTVATLGDEDVLNRFSYVNLELKKKDKCVLYYCEKGGNRKTVDGKYQYDKDAKTITLSLSACESIKREFPISEGIITISLPIGDKTLVMQFKQK